MNPDNEDKQKDPLRAAPTHGNETDYEFRRRERELYQERPSYVHPVTGAPLMEPYKPSKEAGLVTVRGVPVEKLPPLPPTLEEVLAEAQKNKRVCPLPQRWQELYEMLPNKRRQGNGWEPALPLILAAWWDTPALSKMARLREHIEWAAAQGVLAEVHSFLRELPEDQWHHVGE